MSDKRYLGDAVYAEFGPLGIILTTEDGISVTNRIVLEPEVFNALRCFEQIEQMKAKNDAFIEELKNMKNPHGGSE